MQKPGWTYIPLIGIPVFVLLYIAASFYYPGGSHEYPQSTCFSWAHNYWCNLLDEKAINGQTNTARPIALSAMLTLCICFIVFWNYFPQTSGVKKWTRSFTRFSGLAAMLVGAFLGTLNHDAVIDAAGFLGLIAVGGLLYIIKKAGWNKLFIFGLFSLGLMASNRIIYETGFLWTYLPVIQKFTFLAVLIWIWLLTFCRFRHQ